MGVHLEIIPKWGARCAARLFLDLDEFKQVNDTFGHHIGDRLLQAVATALIGCLRASDTVSRHGGDEFVVLVADSTAASGVALLADRILQETAGIRELDGHAIEIGVSIGIALYPTDGYDANTLIKHADFAMYQAKAKGGSTYQFYDAALDVRALVR